MPEPLNFSEIFENPNQPLHIDIGCALGQFVRQMAKIARDWNFLGLEIREAMVLRAHCLAAEDNLTNLHYAFCNATISLDRLLANAPKGVLQTVTIQFPDPWAKKRHFKRRVVQPNLVTDLAKHLAITGKVFIQSDVEPVAEEICDFFAENQNFCRSHDEKWLTENPFPIKTERETVVEANNLPIFRAVFERV